MDETPRWLQLVEARLEEPSTWQAIGFVLTALGSQWAVNVDWGQSAFVGSGIVAVLKIVTPDGMKVWSSIKTIWGRLFG